MKHPIMIVLLAAALSFSAANAMAADEVIFGWQIMTQEERTAYQNHINSLNTEAARDNFREEHRQKMIERAQRRGVKLPGMSANGGSH